MRTILSMIPLLLLLSFSAYSQEYEYIEIKNLVRKPIIKGTLNGKDAYFLLDTGSDLTILNSKDSKKYNFKVIMRDLYATNVVSLGGLQSDIFDAFSTNLKIGSQSINSRIYSYDLTPIINSLYTHSRIKISGIIGSNIMKEYGFVIDYRNKEVGITILNQKKANKS